MAITSYGTLKTAIADWTHRSDLTSQIDDFIDIAEARFNRALRVSQMEEESTITPVAGLVTMPTDWLAVRNVKLNTNPLTTLEYLPPAEMDRLAIGQTLAGKYTIVGDQIKLDAASNYDVIVEYYKKITALDDTNTSNWLLDTHPDMYLYGCLAQAFVYAVDDTQVSKYNALCEDVISKVIMLDNKRKYAQNLRVRVA
jgi:hypothetical protein